MTRRFYRIGALEGLDVVLDKPPVSGEHAQLSFDGEKWWIRDLNSTNGTFVDEQRLGSDAVPLSARASLRFGSFALSVDELFVRAIFGAFSERWVLGAEIGVEQVVLGSGVSGRHASIFDTIHGYVLCDLSSTNGTFVDGRRIGALPEIITDASAISFGKTRVVPRMLEAPSENPMFEATLGLVGPPQLDGLAGTYLIGRSQCCQIVVSQPTASGIHAALRVDQDTLTLWDLGSSNGTFADDSPVAESGQTVEWKTRLLIAGERQTVRSLIEQRKRPAGKVLGAWNQADYVINDPKVSFVHAMVVRGGHGFSVYDLESSNGLFVNGGRVRRSNLLPGDRIGVGGSTLTAEQLISLFPEEPSIPKPIKSDSIKAIEGGSSKRDKLFVAETTSAPSPPKDKRKPNRTRVGGALGLLGLALAIGFGGWLFWSDGVVPSPSPSPDPTPPPPQLEGRFVPAWTVLQRRNSDAALQQAKEEAVALETLGWSIDSETGGDGAIQPNQRISDHLRSRNRAQRNFDANQYSTIPFRPDTTTSSFLKQEQVPKLSRTQYVVPNLGAILVRDQKRRGTCAAFAGIGAVELAVLKRYPYLASELNLSEQYFYYLSKPQCQDGSCRDSGKQGSSYVNGFQNSVYQPGLNIPSERDCRYVDSWRGNDVQAPLSKGCERGVVDVVDWSSVHTISSLIKVLEDQKVPVAIGTRLSDGWLGPFSHRGRRIFSVKSEGKPPPSKDSDGHAYLIVGYRKLKSLVDGDSFCFILKNSWGRGWGRSGYACATPSWLKAHAKGGELGGAYVSKVKVAPELSRKRKLPKPKARPKPPKQWRAVSLSGPDGIEYFASVHRSGSSIKVKGVLSARERTQSVSLRLVKGRIYHNGTQVGRLRANRLQLCSVAYDSVCALEVHSGTKSFRVRMLGSGYGHAMSASPPNVVFIPILTLPDKGTIEASLPGIRNKGPLKVRVRYTPIGGTPSPELEIAIQNGTDLVIGKKLVGSISPQKLGLCTGLYENQCELILTDDGVVILPSSG